MREQQSITLTKVYSGMKPQNWKQKRIESTHTYQDAIPVTFGGQYDLLAALFLV